MMNYRVDSYRDLLEAIDDIYESLSGPLPGIWWRGQADHKWKLVPSVHRPRFRGHEHCLTQDFIRRAKTRYLNCPPEQAWPDWLILMQHHGLPTRLLDWSESPLVGAYFAATELPDKDGSLWVLNPYGLNEVQNNTERIIDCYEGIVVDFFAEAFNSAKRSVIETVVAIQMPENHQRMLVQRSAFTVHSIATPINELDNELYLSHITIPASLKSDLTLKLSRLGYTPANLFPDLDHLAAELQTRHRNSHYGGEVV